MRPALRCAQSFDLRCMSGSASILRALDDGSDDVTFKGEGAVDPALGGAADATMAFPFDRKDQNHAHAGWNGLAELDAFNPAEADKAFPSELFPREEACALRGGLDHDDAGQEGSARDVPGDPEFVVADILEANDPFGSEVDDPIEVQHVASLRVDPLDLRPVKQHTIEVNVLKIQDALGRHR